MPALSKKQVIVILLSVVLMGVLLSLDLVPPDTRNKDEGKETAKVEVTADTQSAAALKKLPANVVTQIKEIESRLLAAEGKDRLPFIERLALIYDSAGYYEVSGFYYAEAAGLKGDPESRLQAGDRFLEAFRRSEDSTVATALLEQAGNSYRKVLDTDPKNLRARTGLGVYYVEGSENPMQGINLLREVVNENPDNAEANLHLGLFSLRSGQYDKAVGRFSTVVAVKPSAENYAYLAEAYERSGNKKEAIQALSKAKEYIVDPAVLQGIDQYIETLKNN